MTDSIGVCGMQTMHAEHWGICPSAVADKAESGVLARRPPRAQQGARVVVGARWQLAVVAAVAVAGHQPVVDAFATQRGMVGEQVGGLQHGVHLALAG